MAEGQTEIGEQQGYRLARACRERNFGVGERPKSCRGHVVEFVTSPLARACKGPAGPEATPLDNSPRLGHGYSPASSAR